MDSVHQAFIESYLELGSVPAALEATGFSFSNEAISYYVYLLVDPRNGEVFYVGKGIRNRRFHHEREAFDASASNDRKRARIRDILASKQHVEPLLFQSGLEECAAFALEKETIEAFGRDKLTNYSRGRDAPNDGSSWAPDLLSRLKPFDEWVAEVEPSALAIEIYHSVAESLADLVAEPLLVGLYGRWLTAGDFLAPDIQAALQRHRARKAARPAVA